MHKIEHVAWTNWPSDGADGVRRILLNKSTNRRGRLAQWLNAHFVKYFRWRDRPQEGGHGERMGETKQKTSEFINQLHLFLINQLVLVLNSSWSLNAGVDFLKIVLNSFAVRPNFWTDFLGVEVERQKMTNFHKYLWLN